MYNKEKFNPLSCPSGSWWAAKNNKKVVEGQLYYSMWTFFLNIMNRLPCFVSRWLKNERSPNRQRPENNHTTEDKDSVGAAVPVDGGGKNSRKPNDAAAADEDRLIYYYGLSCSFRVSSRISPASSLAAMISKEENKKEGGFALCYVVITIKGWTIPSIHFVREKERKNTNEIERLLWGHFSAA